MDRIYFDLQYINSKCKARKKNAIQSMSLKRKSRDEKEKGFHNLSKKKTRREFFSFHEESLQWMKQVELDVVDKGRVFDYKTYYGFNGSFTLNGGVLEDGMSLGKALVVSKLISDTREPPNDDAIVYINDNRVYAAEGPYWIDTKATLIACPSQLVKQWKEELLAQDPTLDIVEICSKYQYENTNYRQVMRADVVLTNHKFMLNKNYTSAFHKNYDELERLGAKFLVNHLHGLSDISQMMDDNKPVLQAFRWKRFVIDEAHEVLSVSTFSRMPQFRDVCRTTRSQYRWYLSATPFPDGMKSFYSALYFLRASIGVINTTMMAKGKRKDISERFLKMVHDLIQGIAYKVMRGDNCELHMSKLLERVVYMEMHPKERAIYDAMEMDSYDKKSMRDFCCYPRVLEDENDPESVESCCVNIDDIQLNLLEKNERNIAVLEHMITMDNEDLLKKMNLNAAEFLIFEDACSIEGEELAKCKRKTQSPVEYAVNKTELRQLKKVVYYRENGETAFEQFISNMEREIDSVKELAATNKKRLKALKDQRRFLEATLDKIETRIEEGCFICYNDQYSGIVDILPCGHPFCHSCIIPWIKQQHSEHIPCPMCKLLFKKDDIVYTKRQLKEGAEKDELDESKDKRFDPPESLVNDYGTKIATLMHFIQTTLQEEKEKGEQTPGNSFIVFSQWHGLLKLIGDVLKSNKIPNVYCEGPAAHRMKILESFQDEQNVERPRVMMLSSRNPASGTRLTSANHVFIMDPCSYEIERQAISRTWCIMQKRDVNVYRLIVRDTEEERYFNQIQQSHTNNTQPPTTP